MAVSSSWADVSDRDRYRANAIDPCRGRRRQGADDDVVERTVRGDDTPAVVEIRAVVDERSAVDVGHPSPGRHQHRLRPAGVPDLRPAARVHVEVALGGGDQADLEAHAADVHLVGDLQGALGGVDAARAVRLRSDEPDPGRLGQGRRSQGGAGAVGRLHPGAVAHHPGKDAVLRGWAMAPTAGRPSTARPIMTHEPDVAEDEIAGAIDGSTIQTRERPSREPSSGISSERTTSSGNAATRRLTMRVLAARSASVTGSLPALLSIWSFWPWNPRTTTAASRAMRAAVATSRSKAFMSSLPHGRPSQRRRPASSTSPAMTGRRAMARTGMRSPIRSERRRSGRGGASPSR